MYYMNICAQVQGKKIHGVAVNLPKHTGHLVI